MPLYLVRWAGLHASLVSAPNEEELLNILDQVDDPGGCSFEPYRGPVWIDFELPFEVQDVTPEKQVATDISDYTVEPMKEYSGYMSLEELRTEVPACDWTIAMRQNVLRFAFPHLQGWLEEQAEADVRDEEPAEAFPASLRAALVADLEPLVRYSQRAAEIEARTDHEAQVMRDLNVTMMPPAWTSRDAEDELAQFGEARARLAEALAAKLGVTVAAAAEALESPEVEAGLDDLFDTISAPIDEDEFEGDGPGLNDLRVAFARGQLQEPDDES